MTHHTFIKDDRTIYTVLENSSHPLNGQRCSIEVSLDGIDIPSDVNVLQWYGDEGTLEKQTGNEKITEVPDWMTQLLSRFSTAIQEEIDTSYAAMSPTQRPVPTSSTEE